MKDACYCAASNGSECGDCPSWHFGVEKSTNLATWSYSTVQSRKVSAALARSVRTASRMSSSSLRFVCANGTSLLMFNCVSAMI
jgi:hypothetical protein